MTSTEDILYEEILCKSTSKFCQTFWQFEKLNNAYTIFSKKDHFYYIDFNKAELVQTSMEV